MLAKFRPLARAISSFLGFTSGLLISTFLITFGTHVFASGLAGAAGSIFASVAPILPGNLVSGVVTVSGSTPALNLASVQFQVNGVNLGSQIMTGACAVAWNTTGGPDGTYVVSAIATDTSANVFTSAPVTVTVKNGTGPRPSTPRMSIDTPINGARVGLSFTVAGWAADLGASAGTGVDTVHVWAFPSSGSATFVGVANYGGSRSDVSAAFGNQATNSGFGLTVTNLPIGTYTLTAFAHSTVTNSFNQAQSVTVTVTSLPLMSLDAPISLGTVGSSFYAAGWAIDLAAASGPGVDAVHVWAYPNPGSGQPPVFLGVASYGGARGDVGAAFGTSFTKSGFFLSIASLSPGAYRIVVYAHSTVTGTFNSVRAADVTLSGPLMSIDAPASGASEIGPFMVAGWALDASAASGTGVDTINVWAFPVGGGPAIFAGAGGYGGRRADVAAIFGSQFVKSGYNTRVTLPTGTPSGNYDLVVYAHSPITHTFNQSHTVRVSFTASSSTMSATTALSAVPAEPIPPIVAPSASTSPIDMTMDLPLTGSVPNGPFVVAGWALDREAVTDSGIGGIHVWAVRSDPAHVDPQQALFLGVAESNVSRPDVAAVYGSQFAQSGWELTTSSLTPGEYDIFAYAWNARTSQFEAFRAVHVVVP